MRLFSILLICTVSIFSCKEKQDIQDASRATIWADSVYQSLTPEQRVAQLFVLRLSELRKDSILFHTAEIEKYIKQYNIGAVCLFQGGPETQATIINHFQRIAKTPIMFCIDAETGLGMRMTDSVMKFPNQLTLGAINDSALIYQMGYAIGEQCKRMGIQVNFAPVVDINNNPANPVINVRSFGENKLKVARFGLDIMKGMQKAGILACAKHFPGHGDVAVDSHKDLPVINKSLAELDSLEFMPFKAMIDGGVGSIMVAHLSIPAIDTTTNLPTSLSYQNVTTLLREKLGFTGITFTDALDMLGVAKYYPGAEGAVQSILAGNDMLCLPQDVPASINAILEVLKSGKLSEKDFEARVKKVLIAKYNLGLADWKPVPLKNLAVDLNKNVAAFRKQVAEKSLTVLKLENKNIFPFKKNLKIAYLAIGDSAQNQLGILLKDSLHASTFYYNYKKDSLDVLNTLQSFKGKYDLVIIGLHGYANYPADNFGISPTAINLIKTLQSGLSNPVITMAFGNPYAIDNFCDAKNLVACYENDSIFQTAAFNWLTGKFKPSGKLPVTVCPEYHYGYGL